MDDQTGNLAVQNEIDLRQLILSIWDGKWLIGTVTMLALLLGSGFAFTSPKKFSASMEIQPMSVFDEDAYRSVAELDLLPINREVILSDFIERLLDGDLLEQAMQETGYVNRDEFESDADYQKALRRAAFGIRLIPPTDPSLLSSTQARDRSFSWRLQAEGAGAEKFTASLHLAFEAASEETRLGLKRRFESEIASRRRRDAYRIKDLRREIANALDDYRIETRKYVSFLLEQAEIARELGIADYRVTAQSVTTSSMFAADMATQMPFYLRGYESIEKEIELIEARRNEEDFVPELTALKSTLREIEQDPLLDRAESAFSQTPIATGDGFRPARADVAAIRITPQNSGKKIVALAGLLGIFAGLLILFLRNILRARD